MPRFVIDLGDIDMSSDSQQQLSGALQKVALGYLATLKFERPIAIHFPWEWLGLVMRRDFEQVFNVEKEIGGLIGDIRVGASR